MASRLHVIENNVISRGREGNGTKGGGVWEAVVGNRKINQMGMRIHVLRHSSGGNDKCF